MNSQRCPMWNVIERDVEGRLKASTWYLLEGARENTIACEDARFFTRHSTWSQSAVASATQ